MNTLYTDRLILRPFRSGDSYAMYKNWTYDERVARYCRWHPHKTIEETEAYLQLCLDAEYCWAITLKGNDEPVGCIDMVGVNSVGIPELGYVLMFPLWRQGIMTEALNAVISELFSLGYKKIEACHFVDNPASGRVMEKCGMKYIRNSITHKKFGSDELCEVKYYEISADKSK